MGSTICYPSAGLDLASPDELPALTGVFGSRGLFRLHVTHEDDGLWRVGFESREQHGEPEPNIAALLVVIGSLAGPHRSAWWRCALREFNVGYECEDGPWAFSQALSDGLPSRVAEVCASLRITPYP